MSYQNSNLHQNAANDSLSINYGENKTLRQVFESYIDLDEALEQIAEHVPSASDDFAALEAEQARLLDAQVSLLEKAYHMPIQTMDDAKVKMALWEREVIQSKPTHQVNVSDTLAKSVFDFIKTF